jgi:hypothetical protein
VAVPEWLMEQILETCPPERSHSGAAPLPGGHETDSRHGHAEDCKAAGLPLRYASVKIREGVPVTDLAAQLGHARKSMTLDTNAPPIQPRTPMANDSTTSGAASPFASQAAMSSTPTAT